MSSYDLLVLAEMMPETGALKTAMRGGEYSESELTIRHLANEVARLRATMHAVHGGQRYEPTILLSVGQRQAEIEEEMFTEELREDMYSFVDFSELEA